MKQSVAVMQGRDAPPAIRCTSTCAFGEAQGVYLYLTPSTPFEARELAQQLEGARDALVEYAKRVEMGCALSALDVAP